MRHTAVTGLLPQTGFKRYRKMNHPFTKVRLVAKFGLIASALALISASYAQLPGSNSGLGGNLIPGSQTTDYAPDHFIVVFKPGTSSSIMQSYMQRYGLSIDTHRTSKYFTVLKLSNTAMESGVKPQMLVSQFLANPAVAYAELDGVVTPDFIPNDPQFGGQYHHNNTGQGGGTPDADIDSPEAWDVLGAAPDVIVAILDDGIDWQHEDLAASIWSNTDEIDANGIDDDGNGFIDDVRGWDFADGDNDPDGDAVNSHGTHCAGITGATHNNGIGVSGCGSNIIIMPIRFYPGPSYFSDFANAIDYAWENGADVISASYNIDGYNQTFLNAVKRAETADVIYVNSAGNNGQMNPPRQALRNQATNVIFVCANDNKDNLASFSNYGTLCDVSAPGVNILSLFPDDGYVLNSGTSMSTPLAAGVVAQIRAVNPAYTARQCLDVLIQTSDSIPQLVSKVPGGRRINFFAAVDSSFIPATLDSTEIVLGTPSGGNDSSLLDSDDNRFLITSQNMGTQGDYAVFNATFDSPVSSLRKMRIHVESHSNIDGVSQFVYIYNWTTGVWDNAGNSRLKTTDTEVDFDIATSKLPHYINGSGQIRVRLNASQTVRRSYLRTTAFTFRVDELGVGVAEPN
ncbi:MAG: S8 family serine peptidase [Fimbriimonadaceae bacterium]|nr:MAG: S8 family serine peptidase [Fimbriimonadaceae bacterium]